MYIWDYLMRHKPLTLSFLAIFVLSAMFCSTLLQRFDQISISRETPSPILSNSEPTVISNSEAEIVSSSEPATLTNPDIIEPEFIGVRVQVPVLSPDEVAAREPVVEVPLTSSPSTAVDVARTLGLHLPSGE